MRPIPQRIAEELSCRPEQVIATIEMLNEGSTVPFIARYRKEKTGGLDDTQLRTLEERLRYLTELEERRSSVLESIREQEKLTPDLEKAINEADTQTRLEDWYLPYKKKRRTKAQIAREAGLEPLADDLYGNPNLDPETEAAKYVDAEKGVEDTKAALDGARQILMERFAEDADLVAKLRDLLWNDGEISASVIDGKQAEGAKFSDYFEHSEKIKTCPSHRALALFRGRNENILQLKLTLGAADEDRPRTEQGHAVEIIQRLAMAHPEVAFSLGDGSRTLLDLAAAPDLATGDDPYRARLARLGATLGREFEDNALPASVPMTQPRRRRRQKAA